MSATDKIFPFDVVNTSIEKHLQQYEPRSRVLYLLLLTVFLVAFVLLFMLKVDVTVRSTGLLRPEQERTEIRSLVAGTVDSLFIRENQHVTIGQPMLTLAASAVKDKNLSLGTQLQELQQQQHDLQVLTAGRQNGLQSGMYRQEWLLYRQKLAESATRLATARKNYERFNSLYKDRVISAAEFERYDYEYKAVKDEAALVKAQQQTKWQADLTAIDIQLRELQARQTLYVEQEGQYTVRAAANGYVQQLKGIQPGSSVVAGELLGEVSPDSGLVADVYVLPKDIGYIREGSLVRMQVDAYDYNLWGMAQGRVADISKDVMIQDGQPLFRVRCAIDNPVMALKNGYKGYLKKA
ncbi:HlyD family secretion protein [Chitinophaga sedimenti]|uniref:HlyD family secretion protein n=1 Tax=Chitinophaga sedimenti TaxID=2033606 RepID=UPI0020047343|nr:HlyD family efflux transporter periplasmic adaptor subunit [Chitinophaga sedimenti]MCK7556459.1 HlyD family secretion protein [Chitinophaga sedimenti]